MYLLDRNVVQELVREHPDTNVLKWFDSIDDVDIFVSICAVMELKKGIEKGRMNINMSKSDVSVKANLLALREKEEELDNVLIEQKDRILAIDADIALEWGRLLAIKEKDHVDTLVAATANVKNLTVVSRNVRDFKDKTVAAVLNPFLAQKK